MNSFLVSVPYIYPLCPLNFNHAKMFVVADVISRHLCTQSINGENRIIFPVASHFSGNTAQVTSSHIKDYFCGNKSDAVLKTITLYKSTYKVPVNIIRRFVNPDYLMNYFNEEILWELQSLDVSCDYHDAYTTNDVFFEDFVRAIFRQYYSLGYLIKNDANQLAINYDDRIWRMNTIELINNTDIRHACHKNTILSALSNLSNGWECLRKSGFGVRYAYNGDEWIIDPMFDSELFMVFDLFIYWRNQLNTHINNIPIFFDALYEALKTNRVLRTSKITERENELISYILQSLPCSIFVAEEHLKNWIGKKFFAEQALLHPDLRTRSYRVLGMALLDGKRMSASRGHAILSRDLIKEFGGTITRLVLLMSGGNVSKTYHYEQDLPQSAKKIINNFSDYLVYLKSNHDGGTQIIDITDYTNKIKESIENGYFRQAIIELLVNIPTTYKYLTLESKQKLVDLYHKYLSILIPDYAKRYC